ncbi:uncharacterized protein [Montipora capricornis]|uniref:uncharacterized protein n=1 Tax=Montipora capricornis TaxID=246305 RepID=UPI0035F1F3A5
MASSEAEGVVIITEQSLQIQTSHENITTSALLNEQNHEISVPSHEQNKENTEALNPKNHEISVPSHEQNKEKTEALNPNNKDGRPPKRKNHEPLDGGGELPQRRCWRCQGIGHLQWECPSSRRGAPVGFRCHTLIVTSSFVCIYLSIVIQAIQTVIPSGLTVSQQSRQNSDCSLCRPGVKYGVPLTIIES